MNTDKVQLQRLELKYRISEEQALAVRDFVRCYLEIDEYGAGQPNLSYRIQSLYLDSDDLTTYRETINGNKNRFKLRLRYYDDAPSSPVFFEIKRRMDNAILKQRGGVRRVAVPLLLAGQLPEPDFMLTDVPKHFVALQRFSHLMLSLQARPKVHVSYLREAWMNPDDNSVRVTMDRDVRTAYEPTARLSTEIANYSRPFGDVVILELKFTGRFPNWFRDLVQGFGLVRSAAAKYADGIEMIGLPVFGFLKAQGDWNAPRRRAEYAMDLGGRSLA